jgi:hypothetical protein
MSYAMLQPYWPPRVGYMGIGSSGFGLDVVFTDAFGTQRTEHPTTAAYCGAPKAAQKMMKDLGFYAGGLDGSWGKGTFDAAKAFAASVGVAYAWGTGGNAAFCGALMDTWSKHQAGAPVVTGGAITPSTPPGGTPAQPPPAKPPAAQPPPAAKLPAGSPPGTPPGAKPGAKGGVMAWWNSQKTPVKVGIGIGAVALLGGVAWMVMGGKKKPAPRAPSASLAGAKATPNRRAKHNGAIEDAIASYQKHQRDPIVRSRAAAAKGRAGRRAEAKSAFDELVSGRAAPAGYEKAFADSGYWTRKKATPNRRRALSRGFRRNDDAPVAAAPAAAPTPAATSTALAKAMPNRYIPNAVLSKSAKRELSRKKRWTAKDKKRVAQHVAAMVAFGRASTSDIALAKRSGIHAGAMTIRRASRAETIPAERAPSRSMPKAWFNKGNKETRASKRYVAGQFRRVPGLAAYVAKGQCRFTPPKSYRKLGATKRSDYAFPECFKYPIKMKVTKHTKAHIRTAASRFGKHKARLPPAIRAAVAKRIDAAKKQHHIGPYRAR